MRIFSLLILCFGFGLLLQGRTVQPFNDGWQFKKGAVANDTILYSSSFHEWEPVSIPHTWNNTDMQTARNNYYAGEAYYKKSYLPDTSLKGKRIFLRFEGVGSVAEIYVNKHFAGNHLGGYSAFVVEISDMLKYGVQNQIVVKVNNASRPDVIPVNNVLFGVYGGIYRPVSLIVTDKINIAVTDNASSGVYITQNNVNAAHAGIGLKIKLENKYRDFRTVTLSAVISQMDGSSVVKKDTMVVISPQGRQFIEQQLQIEKPHLWQGLEDPYLYRVTIRVFGGNRLIDEVIQPLGVRKFELRAGDGMYLNGRKVPMYGVCRHQDWWQLGSALTNVQHDTDLALIKEIGATTIRLAHYQQSDYFYSKCDSTGFIVWAEIPFVNEVSTHEADNARQHLTELIRQNYNHPCIYVWGLHNEVYSPAPYVVSLTATLNDLAKTEDPYRYTISVNGFGNPGHAVNMNADIQGINRYFGWYEKTVYDMLPWIEGMEKNYPGYKVMLAEYGAEANVNQQQELVGDTGDCCGFNRNYNETFATHLHEVQWGYIASHPYLLASYLWNMFDFATPASAQGGVPARNMKGLVTFDRKTKKDPFYWYKANWSKEPVLYITQRRVTKRSHRVTNVTVYSNIGIPRLFVNGKECKSFVKGTTAVHYIFENIRLRKGKNSIEAKAFNKGNTLTDSIVWFYSAQYKDTGDMGNVPVNPEEHVGLQ